MGEFFLVGGYFRGFDVGFSWRNHPKWMEVVKIIMVLIVSPPKDPFYGLQIHRC